jgi:hypothetical protein
MALLETNARRESRGDLICSIDVAGDLIGHRGARFRPMMARSAAAMSFGSHPRA